jgi:hypothetical protein
MIRVYSSGQSFVLPCGNTAHILAGGSRAAKDMLTVLFCGNGERAACGMGNAAKSAVEWGMSSFMSGTKWFRSQPYYMPVCHSFRSCS